MRAFDVNGDGHADLLIGAPYGAADAWPPNGRAYSFVGGSSDPAPVASASWTGLLTGGSFGAVVSGAGDVNGDGYSDAVVGAPLGVHGEGAAYVFLGGPQGLASSPSTILADPSPPANFGVVAGGGDVNGDGYDDVVVGAPDGINHVCVYFGGPNGIASSPDVILPDATGMNGAFGCSVASGGDVDGDGYDDIVIGAYTALGTTGIAYVYLGSPDGPGLQPSQTIQAPGAAMGEFGLAVASAGDVDADGYADALVSAPAEGRVYLFRGGIGGLHPTPATILVGDASAVFGSTLSTAGDVDGDGYADVVVGSSLGDAAFVYLGGKNGLASTAAASLPGNSVGGVGDVDGDGFDDVVVGAPGQERAYVYRGGAQGVSTKAWTMVAGSEPKAEFGSAVGRAR